MECARSSRLSVELYQITYASQPEYSNFKWQRYSGSSSNTSNSRHITIALRKGSWGQFRLIRQCYVPFDYYHKQNSATETPAHYFRFIQIHLLGWWAGIATGYGLDDRGVGLRVPVRSRILSSPRRPHWMWGPPSLLHNGYLGLFPRR
jgi:hypothetical protein